MKRFLWALGLAVACGGEKPPAEDKKPLGGEIAARVGEVPIPASLVLKVAEVQKISPQDALKRLVDDAIAAESARKKGLDKELPERWLLIAANGRFTADRWAKDAKAMGPPNPQEMEAVSKLYWELIDRPPAADVVHAVVQPKGDKEAARKIAANLYRGIRGEHDWGQRFDPEPAADVLDLLGSMPPREMRRALVTAFGNARLANRYTIEPDDLPRGGPGKARIGFLQ